MGGTESRLRYAYNVGIGGVVMNQKVARELRKKAYNIWRAMPRTDKDKDGKGGKMSPRRVYKLVKKDYYGVDTYGCGCKRDEHKKLCSKHGRT